MAVPDRRIYTSNATRVGRVSSLPTWRVPEPCRAAHISAERAGTRLILAHYSDTSPVLLPLVAPPIVFGGLVRQPVGTGNAPIRWSIDPNRRRVR